VPRRQIQEAISSLILEVFRPSGLSTRTGRLNIDAGGKTDDQRPIFSEGPILGCNGRRSDVGTVSGLPKKIAFTSAVWRSSRGLSVLSVASAKRCWNTRGNARDKGSRKLFLYSTFVLPGAKPPIMRETDLYFERDGA